MTAWNPNPNNSVSTILADGGAVYVGGTFSSIGGQGRNLIAALDASTGLAIPSFNAQLTGAEVRALATDGAGTLYVGGAIGTFAGQIRRGIAALDLTGAVSLWNPNIEGNVNALVLDGNTIYAVGTFPRAGGITRNNAVAIDRISGAIGAWDPNANAQGSSVFVDNGTVYVGGNFTTIGGAARNHLAALDPVTAVPTAWDPNVSGQVNAMARVGGLLYIAGAFNTVHGQTRFAVATLDPTTAVPTAWNPNITGGAMSALRTQPGAILLGGQFTTIGGQPNTNLAIVTPDVTVDVPSPARLVGVGFTRVGPNPATGPVRIEYALSEAAHVRLTVCDVQGRVVARLVEGAQDAGEHGSRGARPHASRPRGLLHHPRRRWATRRETGGSARMRSAAHLSSNVPNSFRISASDGGSRSLPAYPSASGYGVARTSSAALAMS